MFVWPYGYNKNVRYTQIEWIYFVSRGTSFGISGPTISKVSIEIMINIAVVVYVLIIYTKIIHTALYYYS